MVLVVMDGSVFVVVALTEVRVVISHRQQSVEKEFCSYPPLRLCARVCGWPGF